MHAPSACATPSAEAQESNDILQTARIQTSRKPELCRQRQRFSAASSDTSLTLHTSDLYTCAAYLSADLLLPLPMVLVCQAQFLCIQQLQEESCRGQDGDLSCSSLWLGDLQHLAMFHNLPSFRLMLSHETLARDCGAADLAWHDSPCCAPWLSFAAPSMGGTGCLNVEQPSPPRP